MSIEHQRRVLEVLDEVLEAPAEKRAGLLAELCGDDLALAEEVRALVEAEEPGGLLGMPAFDVHSQHDPALGRRIGDYELVELLGRGGMGTVYLARRGSFEQRVAIKIIRRGLDLDPVLVQRFENERAILARLEHPAIARLLDGGTTGDGLPYVVMEYVRGEPIDAYCRRHALDVRARLELFCQVLDAVQYAHRNLVVHRDLKPGNILVDAEGSSNGSPDSSPGSRVKLLDFGIAKLLDESLAASPLNTATGEAPMTPRYASPEQIRRQPISTASDVYVLGVLLFELLTGLDVYGADTSDPSLLSRAVLEREPERPSTAVRRRAPELSVSEIKRLRSRLAGDLDAIVGKAMRKEPGERYGSVEQLADDIRRHLGGEPVRARRGTFGYRAGKFVRRHRVGLAVLALFIVILASATGISFHFYLDARTSAREAMESAREAKQSEDEARASAERAERLLEFVKEDLLQPASPDESGRQLTIFALLSRGQEKLLHEDLDDLTEADRVDIAGTLGEIWLEWGESEKALETMRAAADWAVEAHGADHPEVTKRFSNSGAALVIQEDYESAVAFFRRLVRFMEQTDSNEKDVFRIRANLATALMYLGELEEAREIQRDILERRSALYLDRDELEPGEYGADDKDVATSRHNLGAVLYAAGEFEEARRLVSDALRSRERVLGRDHRRTATTRDLLGQILLAQERTDDAIESLEKALAHRLDRLGAEHIDSVESRIHLAEALLESDSERAEALLGEALAALDDRPGSWRTDDARSVLALLQARRDELEDPKIAKESYERLARVRGERSTVSLRAKARWQKVEKLTASRVEG